MEHRRREAAARAAIRQASGSERGADSIDLFISHHLEELPQGYWQLQLATPSPSPGAVIDLLVRRSSWGQDDGEYFDFTLPGDVTDYVVSVHFNSDGIVDSVSMES